MRFGRAAVAALNLTALACDRVGPVRSRPVLAFSSLGDPWIGVLAATGFVWLAADSLPLAELAALFQLLGATGAINLDDGGSTTMVVRDGGRQILVNRPSDPSGERAVANALAVIKRCG